MNTYQLVTDKIIESKLSPSTKVVPSIDKTAEQVIADYVAREQGLKFYNDKQSNTSLLRKIRRL